MHEHLVKRTIWIYQCPSCEFRVERVEAPPKSIFCDTCGVWVPRKEVSFTGHDLSGRK